MTTHERNILYHILLWAVAIGIVAYALIVGVVLSVPHFPLSGKQTFKSRMRVEITMEKYAALMASHHSALLVLGSSSMERGINEAALDRVLAASGENLRSINAATSGMFARANLSNLRAMLTSGILPDRIVYGFLLSEPNARSTTHDNTVDPEAEQNGLYPKSLLNLLRFGPATVSNLLDPSAFRTYYYLLNDGFRNVDTMTAIQKLLAGKEAVERDSNFQLSPKYLNDLKTFIVFCRYRHLPLALVNTPLLPTLDSAGEAPYRHRQEAFHAVEALAKEYQLPLWNADVRGLFKNGDFRDVYHLTAAGSRKFGRWLGSRVHEWTQGQISQDTIDNLPNGVGN